MVFRSRYWITGGQTAGRDQHVRYALCHVLQKAYNPLTANSLS